MSPKCFTTITLYDVTSQTKTAIFVLGARLDILKSVTTNIGIFFRDAPIYITNLSFILCSHPLSTPYFVFYFMRLFYFYLLYFRQVCCLFTFCFALFTFYPLLLYQKEWLYQPQIPIWKDNKQMKKINKQEKNKERKRGRGKKTEKEKTKDNRRKQRRKKD